MKKGEDCTGISIIFICHDGEGNFLFGRRSTACRDEHGAWDPGGGALELHDTVEGTLKKEIAEEYCTDILDCEFLGFRDVHRENNGAKTHWLALDFKVRVDRLKVKNGEPHKLAEIGWFTLDTIPHPQHSTLPNIIEKYGSRLRAIGA